MDSSVLTNVINWIMRAVIFGTVVMYGALGETLTEKSGNMNLGIPGVMCIGGAGGFIAAFTYESQTANPSAFVVIVLALAASFIAAAAAGALFCLLTTTLRANQNVTGLALTIFGVGAAKFFCMSSIPEGETTVKAAFTNSVFAARLPFADKLGEIGQIFFGYGFMMYLAIIIAIGMSVFLFHTRKGLNLRAVGESPQTADAAGVSVIKNKYLATVIGAGIAGLGGAYYVLDYNYGSWSTASASSIEALGWLALALVIFAAWKPLNLIWGSYLFGLCYWLYNYITIFNVPMTTARSKLFEAVPYIVTIVVLIVSSSRKHKSVQPPASLGLTYFREER